ncbi:TraB/GumN family protein [Treponema socranskii]|uniref:TraB/GumN family protein n=1 Tax=Treponema socranskii TaxID=53419 RepID=UPI0028720C63|nr:TraB/GumN family protein [Treponema socranskii]MDR9860283.1 TraB/GumN family protein [Treponema socranskii]
MVKKNITLILLPLVLSAFVSCASNRTVKNTAYVTERARMFWQIDGIDADGKPSVVYIQGTIHVGDKRLYPLAPSVVEAWNSADRIVGEISTTDWAKFQNELQNRIRESVRSAGGRRISDALTSEQKRALYSVLGKAEAEQTDLFEPWVTNLSLQSLVYTNSGLSAEQGLDGQFMLLSYRQNREMEGLDDLETQFDVLAFGTYDEQLVMLQDVLDDIAGANDIEQFVRKLYDAYLTDDAASLDALLKESYRTDGEPAAKAALYKAYYEKTFTERNRAWAKKIAVWLSEGGTTFIFAGAGHFIGEDSVFSYLRKNGKLSH